MPLPRALYVVRFPSEEEAVRALRDTNIEPSDEHFEDGEPLYMLGDGKEAVDVYQSTDDRAVLIGCPGMLRYLDEKWFLDPEGWHKAEREKFWWGEDVLVGLELLRTTPGVQRGALFYGNDSQGVGEEFTPVDPAFMAALRKFAKRAD